MFFCVQPGERLDLRQCESLEDILKHVRFRCIDLEATHLDDEVTERCPMFMCQSPKYAFLPGFFVPSDSHVPELYAISCIILHYLKCVANYFYISQAVKLKLLVGLHHHGMKCKCARLFYMHNHPYVP
ncbi:hypothetical protein DPMN_086517 [Dreissena polymorpha]|uniref:Uncharacterized protein n=1 Tax=Dreissena polymorpha TaxID=45954 RepID=A0A9D4QUN4_DREPO|nr:hypothetical protein DPMN_086517 [Dreissena polymorpha]